MQAPYPHIAKDGFRLRGLATSRIDSFSDVVFGFALTLIVVSLEVPKTYDELHKILLGFVPFFISFMFLFLVWWAHSSFFRRYGVHDTGTILINAVLLFTVLFYVYPLKFLFTLVGAQIIHAGSMEVFSSPGQNRELMIVYGAGFAAIYFCFAALYWNAWRQRRQLRLSPLEETLTKTYMWNQFGVGCVGILCCVAARLLPPADAGAAGWFFFLLFAWKSASRLVTRSSIRDAYARTSLEDRTHSPLPHG